MRNKLLLTLAILTLVATGAMALENLPAATGTLVSQADMTIVVDTAEGEQTFLTNETTEWIDKVETGDTILVRYDPEENHAIEVFEVHEKIKVTDQLEGERRAIFGKVTGSTPNELLPDDFVLPQAGSVEISSEPIEEPETETVVAETTVMVETTPEPQPEAQPEPQAEMQMASLPQTASPLPLIGLLGALSLGGGVTLRRLTRK